MLVLRAGLRGGLRSRAVPPLPSPAVPASARRCPLRLLVGPASLRRLTGTKAGLRRAQGAPPTCPLRRLGSRPRRSELAAEIREEVAEAAESGLQKFRRLSRDYAYAVLPIHFSLCALWLGGLYALAKEGVDILAWLQWLNVPVPEAFLEKLRSRPELGSLALTYAVYKVLSPLRYVLSAAVVSALVRRRLLPTTKDLAKRLQRAIKGGE